MKKSIIVLTCLAILMQTNVCFGQKVKKVEQPRKDSLTISKVWGLSMVLPGAGQIINKQYYKIPIFYAGIVGFGYLAHKNNKLYHEAYNKFQMASIDPIRVDKLNGNFGTLADAALYSNNFSNIQDDYLKFKQYRNIAAGAATAMYLLSVADAVVNFNDKQEHSVAKATILSTIFPGLGQAYNRKYWKIPIIYGGFSFLGYAVAFNSRFYNRYKTAYNYVTDRNPETIDEFNGRISADQLKSNRDYYRRYRDYSILGCAALYILNIIDAHVDANLYDYEIDDNLALRVTPTFINETGYFAQQANPFAPGLKVTFNF